MVEGEPPRDRGRALNRRRSSAAAEGTRGPHGRRHGAPAPAAAGGHAGRGTLPPGVRGRGGAARRPPRREGGRARTEGGGIGSAGGDWRRRVAGRLAGAAAAAAGAVPTAARATCGVLPDADGDFCVVLSLVLLAGESLLGRQLHSQGDGLLHFDGVLRASRGGDGAVQGGSLRGRRGVPKRVPSARAPPRRALLRMARQPPRHAGVGQCQRDSGLRGARVECQSCRGGGMAPRKALLARPQALPEQAGAAGGQRLPGVPVLLRLLLLSAPGQGGGDLVGAAAHRDLGGIAGVGSGFRPAATGSMADPAGQGARARGLRDHGARFPRGHGVRQRANVANVRRAPSCVNGERGGGARATAALAHNSRRFVLLACIPQLYTHN
mmetsp:Transcript_16507/g.56140  ORF Transcript_16507/g.56140 Transcript_16507/m.56140 type:complete len:381 (+) Transcript_16507:574-1716(+)